MKKNFVTVALAKGRLAQSALELFAQCGIVPDKMEESTRKLVFGDEENGVRFIMVKPSDVPTYVEHGIADIGVVGRDTLLESGLPLYEMLDLKFGACRLCVAGYPKTQKRITASVLRVATKYPKITKRYYAEKGEAIEVITLHGSVELAPILGLSDVILDLVESGRTLKENGLTVLEEVCDVSARLAVNRVSLKTKAAEIGGLLQRIRENVEGNPC